MSRRVMITGGVAVLENFSSKAFRSCGDRIAICDKSDQILKD